MSSSSFHWLVLFLSLALCLQPSVSVAQDPPPPDESPTAPATPIDAPPPLAPVELPPFASISIGPIPTGSIPIEQVPVDLVPTPSAAAPSGPVRTTTYVPYAGPSESSERDGTWNTVLTEGFEGSWPPGGWNTFDNSQPPGLNGEYCWRNVTTQGFQSPSSAWPAAGCANAIDPGTGAPYPANADSWLELGPFSLSGATAAQVRFRLLPRIMGQTVGGQVQGDRILWLASTDNVNFYGFGLGGPPAPDAADGGWQEITFDLTEVPSLGSLLGQTQVWVAWVFVSDGAQADAGPFLDDVNVDLQWNAGGAGTGPLGGRGFAITRSTIGTTLTWSGGSQQTGYQLVRIPTASGSTPVFSPLPPSATSHTDTTTLASGVYCYVVAPMNDTTPIGLSDSLCVMPNTRTGNGVPGQFTMRLNQSQLASFSWTAPGGQSGYLLAVVPLNGSKARFTPLLPSAITTTDSTSGIPTCYLLVAVTGTTPIGSTDVLCAIPNASNLPGAPSSSGATTPVPRATPSTPTAAPSTATPTPTTGRRATPSPSPRSTGIPR